MKFYIVFLILTFTIGLSCAEDYEDNYEDNYGLDDDFNGGLSQRQGLDDLSQDSEADEADDLTEDELEEAVAERAKSSLPVIPKLKFPPLTKKPKVIKPPKETYIEPIETPDIEETYSPKPEVVKEVVEVKPIKETKYVSKPIVKKPVYKKRPLVKKPIAMKPIDRLMRPVQKPAVRWPIPSKPFWQRPSPLIKKPVTKPPTVKPIYKKPIVAKPTCDCSKYNKNIKPVAPKMSIDPIHAFIFSRFIGP